MKYVFFPALLLAGMLGIFAGCTSNDTTAGGHTHGPGSHSHGPAQIEPVVFTHWTDKSELFVEFSPLIVGKKTSFAAHFSDMTTFKAVEEGEVTVRLTDNNNSIVAAGNVKSPSSPGIFRPALTPKTKGDFQLQFIIKTAVFRDTIILENVAVYADANEAEKANPPQPEGDEISFLKEQAWKVEFGVAKAKRGVINEVIRTSGEIKPVKGNEKIVAAKSSGIVMFKSRKLQEGREVKAGEVLFSINSNGLVNANLKERYEVAKAKLEKATANFVRAEDLLAQKVIGQKQYDQRRMEFSVAEAEFATLTNSFNKGGQTITAPLSGIVKNIMVNDGQFVEEGTPLVQVTSNRKLLLQAEVSQKYLPKLPLVRSANFKTAYQESVQSIEDYNGKIITYGKSLQEHNNFIPVLFELDNLNELIPGSFVEMFLLTQPIENTLIIPKSALMQDYNSNYVYVQLEGESFEKREVKLGINDGKQIQILSGLSEGEMVVTKGAYHIKMASMSSVIPAHGHSH